MRADGLKLRKIARRPNEAKIPARRDGIWRATRISIVLQRGGIWRPAQVAKLLQEAMRGDKVATSRRAQELRAQAMPLREIGIHLVTEGLLPRDGGIWHPASVRALLVGDEPASGGG